MKKTDCSQCVSGLKTVRECGRNEMMPFEPFSPFHPFQPPRVFSVAPSGPPPGVVKFHPGTLASAPHTIKTHLLLRIARLARGVIWLRFLHLLLCVLFRHFYTFLLHVLIPLHFYNFCILYFIHFSNSLISFPKFSNTSLKSIYSSRT